MVSSRPLLYMSLPSVAIILGVFWYRRRNKKHLEKSAADSNRNKQNTVIKKPQQNNTDTNGDDTEDKERTVFVSISSVKAEKIPIKSAIEIDGNIAAENDDSVCNSIFGKSAPIEITHNGRSYISSLKHEQTNDHHPQIDTDNVKTKTQHLEKQFLRSIDEDLESICSSVELPGSIQSRNIFHIRNSVNHREEPIVIKATCNPKISPDNSFLDSKYTNENCNEQNNNCEEKKSRQPENQYKDIGTQKIVQKQNKFAMAVDNNRDVKNETAEQEAVNKTSMLSNLHQRTNICSAQKADKSEEIKANVDNTNENVKRIISAGSPALSLCSVQSGDSGTGSSLPRSEDTRLKSTYEFFFPNSLIGSLYGPKRCFINRIKSKTSTSIVIRKNLYSKKLRICVVEGADNDVCAALLMIRQRFPIKKYPNFTMQKIYYALPQTIVPLSTDSLLNLQLNLIEGINNDVVVSAVMSGGHVFIQHPLHPSHPSLPVLQSCLSDSYSSIEAPLLPKMEINAVCVLSINGCWYRVQIVEQDADDEQRCLVKFLDYGGYFNVSFKDLRQIRSDFLAVPFQATECMLSNIEPIDSCWSQEVSDVLSKLTKGIVLQAQVAGYNANNIPEIYLFACLGPNNVIFINRELVARNLAKWVESQ